MVPDQWLVDGAETLENCAANGPSKKKAIQMAEKAVEATGRPVKSILEWRVVSVAGESHRPVFTVRPVCKNTTFYYPSFV